MIELLLEYGVGGHEREYLVQRTDSLDELDYLPKPMRASHAFDHFDARTFEGRLSGYRVENRSFRVEIDGPRNDMVVVEALEGYYDGLGLEVSVEISG